MRVGQWAVGGPGPDNTLELQKKCVSSTHPPTVDRLVCTAFLLQMQAADPLLLGREGKTRYYSFAFLNPEAQF